MERSYFIVLDPSTAVGMTNSKYMKFDILSIFPEIFDSYFNESIIKRAQKKKKISIKVTDIRKFATGKHRQVDDKPYGGGAGMVMMVEPILKALQKIRGTKKVILFDPRGKKFDQKMARRFAKLDKLVMICGRYEGVDERILEFVDEQVSIGDYVLTGGEIPAMVVLDAVTRLIPGVLGKEDSYKYDTFSKEDYKEHAQYTRPEVFKYQIGKQKKALKVPKVLLSGDHKKIEEWRNK